MEAASHAAGTIWSICVDSPPDVKSTLATTSTIRALIQLLSVQNVEAQVFPIAQLSIYSLVVIFFKTRGVSQADLLRYLCRGAQLGRLAKSASRTLESRPRSPILEHSLD